jgi:predicted  nucleic acid-binding Zn-ribbon protein
VTLDLSHLGLLVTLASLLGSIAGAGGAWWTLRYQVASHERSVTAAHRRLDDHHERLIRLEERSIEGGKRIEEALQGLRSEQALMRQEIAGLRDDLRRHIEREAA